MARPMATTQDFVNWVCGDRIRPRFLLHVFRAMRGEFLRLTMGSTHQTIYMPDVRSFSTPLPPLDAQEEIIAFLDRETTRIDRLIAKKRRLIELLREKRQAVISHAVTKGLHPNAPMKDSGIEWLGEIPAHWEVKRLKHISPSQTVGIVVNPSTFVADEGPAFIYGSDVREGWIAADQARRISLQGNQENCKSILRSGDLVTVRVGYPGLTAVVPESLDGANCASIMITRRSTKFVSEWLAYAFNSRLGRHQVRRVQYGAAQEQFNISHAVEFCFPVPPRADQQAIVDYLDNRTKSLEHSISLADNVIAKLEERRAALIAAAVTGKIDVRALPTDTVEAAD
jgi:type I restriction enzyme, S subunit